MPTINETREKLVRFAYLEKGWHFGEGIPALPDALIASLRILDELAKKGFVKANAFPGIAGEVRVTAYADRDYYEFTAERNGTISYIYEQDNIELEDRDLASLDEAISLIDNLEHRIWDSSVISIPRNTMIRKRKGSKALPSVHRKTGGFPWSISSALKVHLDLSANTASSTTERSAKSPVQPAIPSSSGKFPMIYYPEIARSDNPTATPEIPVITRSKSGTKKKRGRLSSRSN